MADKTYEESTIICRCSDITLKEIRELIEQGYTEPDEIKRILRAGMGPCQGRTCGPLILREVARMTGRTVDQVIPFTYRPPTKGIKLGAIAKGGELDD